MFVSILEVSGASNLAQLPRLTCFGRPVRLLIKYSMTESNHKVLTANVPNSPAHDQARRSLIVALAPETGAAESHAAPRSYLQGRSQHKPEPQ